MYFDMREFSRLVADKIIKRCGLYLVRVADYNTVVGSQFRVPLEECYNGYAFPFGPGSRNPEVVFLMEYAKNPDIPFEQSFLKEFMSDFRHWNLQKAIFGEIFDENCKTAQIELRIPFLDITQPFLPMPWSTPSEIARYKRSREVAASRRSLSDPRLELDESVIEREGRKEYGRLIATYESIRKHGYVPDTMSDGSLDNRFIQVVILRGFGEERFVVMSGHHRVAALSVLGWTEIPAILVSNGMPIVDIANVENWPVVRAGIYDLRAAHRVFKRFFEIEACTASAHHPQAPHGPFGEGGEPAAARADGFSPTAA